MKLFKKNVFAGDKSLKLHFKNIRFFEITTQQRGDLVNRKKSIGAPGTDDSSSQRNVGIYHEFWQPSRSQTVRSRYLQSERCYLRLETSHVAYGRRVSLETGSIPSNVS